MSSEWRKRKRKPCEPNCRVIQAKLGPPSVKRFVPKPVVPERVACRCDEEGDAPLEEERMVCNLNALLGKEGMELVEAVAEAPETPEGQPPQAPAPRPPASPANAARPRAIAMRRGGQRWSTLVSAPTSRIARVMRPVLGDALWHSFVAHANAHYKEAFVGAFAGPVLACVGRDGAPCPRAFRVDLAASATGLPYLHLDHEQDLQVTCDMWKQAWRAGARQTWHDGVDGSLLCHLLFGVRADLTHGAPVVRFRCGPLFLGSGEGYCHQLNMPHYRGMREVSV